MKSKILFLAALGLALTTLTFVSCRHRHTTVVVGSDRGHVPGPPPHAPAHGYRHKHGGAEFVYDSAWGVYVVVGWPSHYYHKGHYYRQHESRWEMGVHMDGPWKAVSREALPQGLRSKAKGKGKSKERPGRGRGLGKKK
ncbi:MAG: hypothetical protein ACYSYV_05450 [Planctomycetota bacterium]